MHGIMLSVTAPPLLAHSVLHGFLVLYVGPDQILPLTSALGAVVGVLLMFWHRAVALARRSWQWCMRKLRTSAHDEP